jgi:hypothetical protein
VIRVLAKELDVCEKTARRVLTAGEGVFWSVGGTEQRLELHGWRRVHEVFKIPPGRTSITMQMKHLRGGIGNFRRVIYAMCIHLLTKREGNDMLTREQVAEGTGVSVTSTKKMEDPWVEVMPCVEVLGKTKGNRMVPLFPTLQGRKKGATRMWPATDGSHLLVRQSRNRYRSKLTGFGSRPLRVIPRLTWLFALDLDGLVNVPPDVHPVDALEVDVDYEQEAFGGEEEEAFTVCTAPLIVVPAGWHR